MSWSSSWLPRIAKTPSRAHVAPVAVGDVIAAEHDEIRPLAREGGHRASDVDVRHPAAAVDVGEKPDPHAGERGRQAGHRDRRARHRQFMALVHESVRTAPGHGDARRGERLQHRPARHRHHLYSNGSVP